MKKVLLFAVISVLIVSVSITSISAQSQYDIPSWVKGIAGFWAEDKITDKEFGEGLSFLIDNGIIKVPLIQELQNKITQLESELRDEPKLPEPQISITVSTDKNSYGDNDLLTIKGLVKNYSSGDITLVVSDPNGDSVAIDQLTPNANGEFTTNFSIGFTFDYTGTYKITVNHKGIIATTTFEFTGGFIGHEFGITAKTNYDSYTNLDVVKISGTVNPFVETLLMTIQVISPKGQIVAVDLIEPKFDGTFSYNFVAGGALWESSGDYTIQLRYLEDATEITFKYIVGVN